MRAEALAKQNTGKDEIMSMVNQVRQRADVMMPKVEDAEGSNLSYDQLLDVVKHEEEWNWLWKVPVILILCAGKKWIKHMKDAGQTVGQVLISSIRQKDMYGLYLNQS